MFGELKNITKTIKGLQENEVLYYFFNRPDIKKIIIDYNTTKQLYEGYNADNKALKKYAPYTIWHKKNIAPKYGGDTKTSNTTLKDTGGFYKSFKVFSELDEIRITADSIKEGDDLEAKYGHVAGLNSKIKIEMLHEIKPILIKEIRKLILG